MIPAKGSLWDRILGDVAEQLPKFNDDLLLNFRERKIEGVGEYLDELFKELELFFGKRLLYLGYKRATPEDRIQYYLKDKLINKRMNIQPSTFKLYIFDFEFENQLFQMPVHAPYIDNHRILIDGVGYYPMFAMTERVVHRIKDGIRIKVLRAPLSFWKIGMDKGIVTVSGKIARENLITVRIHQFSKPGNKPDATPLCIYHFITMGLCGALEKYGYRFNRSDGATDDFMLTESVKEESGDYEYIKIKDNMFIRVHGSILMERYKLRVLLSLTQIIKFEPRVTAEDLLDPDANYFKFCLGKYTSAASSNRKLLMGRAIDHLVTNATMVDPPAKRACRGIGVEINDLYDLIYVIFYRIDEWMNNEPNNLFNKKIETLDILMQGLVRTVFTEAYNIHNNKKVGLNQKTVGRLMRSPGLHQWKSIGLFSINPTVYNDNWLLSIGATRTKSLELSEMGSKKGQPGGKSKTAGRKPPMELIKAHYSQLVCETSLTIPTSKPCETGTINPYMQVEDDTGSIIEPEWSEQLKNVYD